jgi:DNA-binding Lrp family transcriptional regulator
MVNTVPSQIEQVLEKIKEIKGVEEAYMLYGVYDIMALVKVKTHEEFKGIIWCIRAVEQVRYIVNLMAVS